MELLIFILSFLLGLALGSFANAVIYRLRVRMSPFKGRSLCPKCKQTLKALDLVPVLSYVFLRGRCRYCGKKISLQYPVVELSMALLSLAMTLRFGLGVHAAFGVVLSWFLLVIFVYDLKYQLILDRVSVPAMVFALIGSLAIHRSFTSILLGGILGGGFFLIQYVLSKGRWIGGGDIRLGLVLGLAFGWPLTIVCLILAYFSGAVVSVLLVIRRRRSWSSLVPFGTFLSFAGVVTFLYGNELLFWYLHGGFLQWFTSTFMPYRG